MGAIHLRGAGGGRAVSKLEGLPISPFAILPIGIRFLCNYGRHTFMQDKAGNNRYGYAIKPDI